MKTRQNISQVLGENTEKAVYTKCVFNCFMGSGGEYKGGGPACRGVEESGWRSSLLIRVWWEAKKTQVVAYCHPNGE